MPQNFLVRGGANTQFFLLRERFLKAFSQLWHKRVHADLVVIAINDSRDDFDDAISTCFVQRFFAGDKVMRRVNIELSKIGFGGFELRANQLENAAIHAGDTYFCTWRHPCYKSTMVHDIDGRHSNEPSSQAMEDLFERDDRI